MPFFRQIATEMKRSLQIGKSLNSFRRTRKQLTKTGPFLLANYHSLRKMENTSTPFEAIGILKIILAYPLRPSNS
jgi:hypothetical protein